MNTLCADGAFFARCRYFCKPKQNTFFKVSVRVCYYYLVCFCMLHRAFSFIFDIEKYGSTSWTKASQETIGCTETSSILNLLNFCIGSWHILMPKAEHTSEMPPNSLLLLYDRLCIENEKYPHQNTPILAIYFWYVRMIISTMHNLYHRTRGSQKYTDFSRRNFYIANHKKDLIPSSALNEVGWTEIFTNLVYQFLRLKPK